MNIQVVTKDFDKVADNVKNVADLAKLATSKLRDAYIFESENYEVKKLRTKVFNYAYVYNDKILPFTEASIVDVKELCNTIGGYNYDEFKNNLIYIIKKAEKEEKFCDITRIFHIRILMDFRAVKDESEQAITISDKVMKPLTNSIDGYINYLEEISGLFSLLLSNLRTLNENVGEVQVEALERRFRFYHGLICKNAESIVKSCKYYIELKPDMVSDLGSIDEEPNENYINTWIPEVVKENCMKNNLAELIKYNRRLKKIVDSASLRDSIK